MASVNKVILIGNLTRDPELRYTPKGTAIAEIGLAINRKYKLDSGETREEVTFLDISFWGKGGETIAKWCKKGNPLYVEGRLQMDTWDDKTTGQKKSRIKIIGESFQFLGTAGNGTPAAKAPPAEAPPASDGPPPQEDDIPF